MTDHVNLRISSCRSCPNMRTDRVYTSDSFENVTGWYCKAMSGRCIAELDWNEKDPKIPKWCPLR